MAGVLGLLLQATVGTPAFTTLTYSVDKQDVNLHADLIAAGWNGVTALTANVTIQSTAKLTASSTGTYALATGTFPGGSVINIVNNGYILGHGGNGGNTFNGDNSTAGTNGGPALRVQNAINLTNNGIIGGGGGGGGGGGTGEVASPPGTQSISGGGGGGGAGLGLGGTTVNGYNGVNATVLQAGAGGPSAGGGSAPGGNGGTFGNPGQAGTDGYQFSYPRTTHGKPGGLPGNAIEGIALVTLSGAGPIYGPQI